MNRLLLMEAATAAIILTILGGGSLATWRLYRTHVMPHARTVPMPTPTPFVDPAIRLEQARLLREITDYIGAGISHRQADERDLAIEHFLKALNLDPTNADALRNLRELGIDPSTPAR
jgi:tetratricopeptide (TPR) repeat protein